MANQGWGLGSLLNSIFGTTAMVPGASSVSTGAPFAQYGVFPPEQPPSGPLDAFFPGGATPQQQDALSPGMTKGLNAVAPLLLGAGLVAANSFGTGQPYYGNPGWRPGPMQFARPSDALAKLMMAQQQRRR